MERKVPAHLTPADVDRIVEAYRVHADEQGHRWEPGALAWFEPVVLFAVNTGMRIGEIVALRWADVVLPRRGSGAHGRIYVRNYRRADGTERKTKTGGERTVPITAECRGVLETLQAARTGTDDSLTVFRGVQGGALDAGHVSRTFRRYRKLARLPDGIHFHSLRHTAASWLVSRGVSLRLVQDVLGHSSIRSTEIYSHLLPGATDTIVEALDGIRDVPVRTAPRPSPVAASAICNSPATEKRTEANSYELTGSDHG